MKEVTPEDLRWPFAFRESAPARSPPHEPAYDADPLLDLDQTPAFDPTEPEAIPDVDFDPTLGA